MKILIDAICPTCRTFAPDVFIDRDAPVFPECACGVPMVRAWGRGPTVRPDTIPGGLLIHHGLCNPDGTPKRYDSESEITRACEERGLTRWTDIYEERSLNGAREYTDWLRSGEAKTAREGRQEVRRQKATR